MVEKINTNLKIKSIDSEYDFYNAPKNPEKVEPGNRYYTFPHYYNIVARKDNIVFLEILDNDERFLHYDIGYVRQKNDREYLFPAHTTGFIHHTGNRFANSLDGSIMHMEGKKTPMNKDEAYNKFVLFLEEREEIKRMKEREEKRKQEEREKANALSNKQGEAKELKIELAAKIKEKAASLKNFDSCMRNKELKELTDKMNQVICLQHFM